MMQANTQIFEKYISVIRFKNADLWDIKRYLKNKVKSSYKLVLLKDLIKEQTKRVRPFLEPENDFKILGVNNEAGIFDAYIEKGKNINQPYKIVEQNWLAYNPYRVNVGSIGLRNENQKHDLISPAYVVFSCKERLLPDFLFKLFRTDTFNAIIRENTTGSVRQNLTFDNLQTIEIPLPTIEIQQSLINDFNNRITLANQLEKEAKDLEKEIEIFFLKVLSVEIISKEKKSGFSIVNFKHLRRWDIYNVSYQIESNLYPTYNFNHFVLGDPKYGANVKAVDKQNEYRYIRITDLNENGELNKDIAYPEFAEKQHILEKNDFLIARSGATVGKTFLFEEKHGKAIYAGYLIRFKLNLNFVNPYYILFYTKCKIFKQWILSNQRISAQPNINAQQFLEAPIILPSIEVQTQIVTHINEMKDRIKELLHLAETHRVDAKKEFEAAIF